MKMVNNRLMVIVGAVGLVILVFLVWHVPSVIERYRASSGDWQVQYGAYYRTTQIERAQKETFFSIVLPMYLPDGVSKNAGFSGRLKTASDDGKSEVTILYSSSKAGTWIEIIETNRQLVVSNPQETEKIEIIQVNGTQVSVREGEVALKGMADNLSGVPGFHTWWTRDEILYRATFAGLPMSEVRAVVSSMLN